MGKITTVLRLAKFAALAVGLLLVLSALLSLANYRAFQSTALAAATPTPGRRVIAPVKSPILGRLEIPRLKLSVAILDDDDPNSLALAPGHIPGTSPIGSLGNAGIAGHRDTSFRSLRFIRVGDRIETDTGHHASYIVESLHIVDPDDTALLYLNTSPTLTLVTCYPFDYVGSAPKRFVVQARLAP